MCCEGKGETYIIDMSYFENINNYHYNCNQYDSEFWHKYGANELEPNSKTEMLVCFHEKTCSCYDEKKLIEFKKKFFNFKQRLIDLT